MDQDRLSFDTSTSESVEAEFNRVASQLESVLTARDADVRAMLAQYEVDGVSDDYRWAESRWLGAAAGVRDVIHQIRSALMESDRVAMEMVAKARGAVQAIE
jgi:hypothetical protein